MGVRIMNKKRCKNCGHKFSSPKHISKQQYCSKAECQKIRKKEWNRRKAKRDKGYKAYRKEIQNKWRAKNPHYWRRYKENAVQNEATNKIKHKKPILKIIVKKGTLSNLHKIGAINCDCRLILTS